MFKTARLKLTGWYLLIIMVVSISFSATIYQLISIEINHFADSQKNRIEKRLVLDQNPPPPIILIDDDLIMESQNRLLVNLGIINGVILIVSGSLAYFLAGKTLSPIQKMTEDQKQFISDASHELRTPITALKAMIEVSLRDPNLNLDESKKVLTDAIFATNQLKTLSDSLLELNHLNNNGSSFKLESASIKKIMSESVKIIKPKADKKKITIKTNSIDKEIIVDNQKIQELFLILLDNAIKYSPRSSTIKFIASQTNKHLVVKVIDQGVGISQKDLPHIFNRFYRVDNSRTKNNASGYGLGLSIAQKIVEQHHGVISVESSPKNGSTFSVTFQI
jgi:signal transduction histidine kinase